MTHEKDSPVLRSQTACRLFLASPVEGLIKAGGSFPAGDWTTVVKITRSTAPAVFGAACTCVVSPFRFAAEDDRVVPLACGEVPRSLLDRAVGRAGCGKLSDVIARSAAGNAEVDWFSRLPATTTEIKMALAIRLAVRTAFLTRLRDPTLATDGARCSSTR